jgi:transposase, IS5 family
MSPRGWCTRSRAPPPTRPTSPRRRRYGGADKRPELADREVSWNIAIQRSIIKALPNALRDLAEPVERALSQRRAVVEHPFPVLKNRFRHKKLRCRGLKKNTAQLYTLFALANLVIVKQALLNRPGG